MSWRNLEKKYVKWTLGVILKIIARVRVDLISNKCEYKINIINIINMDKSFQLYSVTNGMLQCTKILLV